MELTKKERAAFINQYEILKRLDPDNADHYDQLATILRDGYAVFYSNIIEWIGNDIAEEKTDLVLDILGLYRMVEAYKTRNPDDEDVSGHRNGHFHGFDGNNETEYLSFARFLMDKQDKFGEQAPYADQTDGFNSHCPMVELYTTLIAAWVQAGKGHDLPKEVILKILNAD